MGGLKLVLRDAFRVAAPYFRSEERVVAWTMLLAIIAMNLSLVGMTVVLNFWNGAFFDSLQNKDWNSFVDLLLFYRRDENGFMPGWMPILTVYIVIWTYRTYLQQWLQIRWRRWMTETLLADWLRDRAYYTISVTRDPADVASDNPDQRVAEDLKAFVDDTLSLGLGLISHVVTLFSFAGILWSLSGTITLLGVTIPGYLLWAAAVYALVGSYVTHWVGRPLARLEFQQQKLEADFRFALVRLRENSEGVALYGGEPGEKRLLLDRFGGIARNWFAIMTRQKWLNALGAGYDQVAGIFPIIVAAPRYFAGQIALGGLTRTAGAFGRVQGALSWFIDAYQSLAKWRATVDRLAGFQRAIAAAQAATGQGLHVASGAGPLELRDATLLLPDGTMLLDRSAITLPQGRSAVISGRSGSGKSTLFRAIAGIWPFGSGTVRRPPGSYLFLPQRPYIPVGSLRRAICYPQTPDGVGDAPIASALEHAGLGHLAPELDSDVNWSQRLSGGEQQRLAVARALLLRPDWLFLDEATASLDPEAEAELYQAIRTELPGTTVISIAHRQSVATFHDDALTFRRTPGSPGTLERQPETTASTALP